MGLLAMLFEIETDEDTDDLNWPVNTRRVHRSGRRLPDCVICIGLLAAWVLACTAMLVFKP